ncbi:MAG: NAD(P)H-binding protein [Burkholderiaceae bacterium]
MRVLVLGGAGFIGRHTVAALLARGHEVVIGSRYPERAARRLPPEAHRCERGAARFEQLLTAESWQPLLARVDVAVNCVGILRQRGAETYEKVHHRAPAALADACERSGVRRLLHISALGLEQQVTSRFLTSKRSGEAALRARTFECLIVRPSLLAGDDGYGSRWFRSVARWPIHFVPASSRGRIAPLDVDDLGLALALMCELNLSSAREIELGGPVEMTITEYLAQLRRQQCVTDTRAALVVRVPHWLARFGSHVCDVLHATPFSFGHLQLMQHDNVPRNNALPGLLHTAASRA